LKAATNILDKHLSNLIQWSRERQVYGIRCTGHSLGAGAANLLTILLQQHLNDFLGATGDKNFNIRGHCFATPGVANHALADPYADLIDNFIVENDIVPRLSAASLLALKEMAIEADRLSKLKLRDEEIFDGLLSKREQILKDSYDVRGVIPGRVFHMYKTKRKITRLHHARNHVKVGFMKKAFNSVDLPEEEKPDVPHWVMEESNPEFFTFVALKRLIFTRKPFFPSILSFLFFIIPI
jgi:hypothetical protein